MEGELGRPPKFGGDSAPAGRARARLRTALALALPLLLLAFLSRRVGLAGLAASVHPPPWWAFALSAVGIALSYTFRGLRIHAELGRRHPVTRWQCLRVMLLHNTAVNVVPMRAGEAAYPLLVHRELGVPLGQAVASLVWIRSQDALLLSLSVLAVLPRVPAWAKVALSALGLSLVLAMIALLERFVRRRGTAPAPKNRLARTALSALGALSQAPRHGLAGWLYGGGSWAVKLLAQGFLLSRLAALGLWDAAAGALGGELAGVLPVQGPAGFGTYEAGVFAGASLHGGPTLRVAAPAIALHLFTLATALLAGGIAYAVTPRPPPLPSDEDDHA
ncbi:MAG TPA: lysylphosphatidylglycerol synthase transmembrane domain-containing protein [Anaeromyxobacter sp.]|nr:lysylphosphatidylglycerol synthase transmembrane domain-containing protein [Anaeromyxobacter sp.]